MIKFDSSVTASHATKEMVRGIIYNHVGEDAEGIVIFTTHLMDDESLAFKFRGSSDLEDEINAEVRVLWRDL